MSGLWRNIDLWLLVAVAAGVSIASFIGKADSAVVTNTTLGLLGLMAVSQLRSRVQVSEVSATWRRGRTDLFAQDFPDEYYDIRAKATHSYFFAGVSMGRTLPTILPDLKRIMKSNGSIKILLPDPTDDALLQMISLTRGSSGDPANIRQKILHSLQMAHHELAPLVDPGAFETRVTRSLPRLGINALDVGKPSELIMVQMYQYRPDSEPSPIFLLRREDRLWFKHFKAEIDALWDSGKIWKP